MVRIDLIGRFCFVSTKKKMCSLYAYLINNSPYILLLLIIIITVIIAIIIIILLWQTRNYINHKDHNEQDKYVKIKKKKKTWWKRYKKTVKSSILAYNKNSFYFNCTRLMLYLLRGIKVLNILNKVLHVMSYISCLWNKTDKLFEFLCTPLFCIMIKCVEKWFNVELKRWKKDFFFLKASIRW